ncbi:MAG TPA: hypothetical protein PLZ45_15830 [Ferruginibacter sp.]|nr:hypothetical protein [Chitinophagaceae bacterium]HRI26147.1 hypothetical protein [Ferruginibacter sp.]
MKPVFKPPFFILVCTLLAVSSCTKPAKDDTGTGLAGDWDWVQTDGGIANHIHETPASTGKNIVLRISGNNSYQVITNGVITNQGTIDFTSQVCIHDNSSKKVIVFSNPLELPMMIEKPIGSTLELSDNANDGILVQYRRK